MSRARPFSLWRLMKGLMLRHMPAMITCQEFEDFILDYLEDRLPAGQRRIFDLHLKICRECRDYLAAYRRTAEIGKAAFVEPAAQVPDDVPEDLVKAILDARRA